MDQYQYFNYLNSRSSLGFIYRNFYLYPKIHKLLLNPVLDVGCGIGDYLKFNREAIGLDVNKYNIESIKSKNLNAIKMNYDEIPFADNTFPSILLDNVLEHIEKPEKLICEMHRVLISEGKLLIGVPGIKGFLADSDHKIFYSEEKLISQFLFQCCHNISQY